VTDLGKAAWWIATLIIWGIALFEYLLQVPANRIRHTEMNLGQLKILQEVITLTVFVPFAVLYMNEKLSWNYLWAGVFLVGAVYFIFGGEARGNAAMVTRTFKRHSACPWYRVILKS
jgi:uncharacterized protein